MSVRQWQIELPGNSTLWQVMNLMQINYLNPFLVTQHHSAINESSQTFLSIVWVTILGICLQICLVNKPLMLLHEVVLCSLKQHLFAMMLHVKAWQNGTILRDSQIGDAASFVEEIVQLIYGQLGLIYRQVACRFIFEISTRHSARNLHNLKYWVLNFKGHQFAKLA